MHGTDASPFPEPETTTKRAKLLEKEIDFFLIFLKIEYSCFHTWTKQNGEPKKANFKIIIFNYVYDLREAAFLIWESARPLRAKTSPGYK